MRVRGLVGADGWLTAAGRQIKARVESVTDDLAAPAYGILEADELEELVEDLEPLAAVLVGRRFAVAERELDLRSRCGVSNPIGLPQVELPGNSEPVLDPSVPSAEAVVVERHEHPSVLGERHEEALAFLPAIALDEREIAGVISK